MIRINLLPHREEKRKALRQQFFALSGLISVLAILIVVLVHGIISGYINQQENKNNFLKKEIASLDKEIDEIKRLKEQTDALLSRKQVIESLQGNRAEAVQLFNEMARQVPSGVYIKSLKQAGQTITLLGYAQSNARVSTLMKQLDASPLLERPKLIEIKSVSVGNRRLSEFNMSVFITRIQPTENTGSVAKPAGTPVVQEKKA